MFKCFRSNLAFFPLCPLAEGHGTSLVQIEVPLPTDTLCQITPKVLERVIFLSCCLYMYHNFANYISHQRHMNIAQDKVTLVENWLRDSVEGNFSKLSIYFHYY